MHSRKIIVARAYPANFLFSIFLFLLFHNLSYSYHTDQSPAYGHVIEDIRPFLGILAGIVGSIFLVAVIIVVVVRVRGSSGRDRNNYSHPGNGGSSTANGNGNLGILGSNNNGSLGIGTLAHNGGQSVQDMHRIGRETCHVTSSLDSIDKNPDIIPQGELSYSILLLPLTTGNWLVPK